MDSVSDNRGTVGLVLAGGGARGAYEIGALAALLPELEEAQRPRVLLGTSVGAINVAYLAANVHRPLSEVAADGIALWSGIRYQQILEPLLSLSELARLGGYAGEVLGVPGISSRSLLDPAPLTSTLPELVDFGQIHRNVTDGHVEVAAVAASSAATALSVVFHDGGPRPPADQRRRIDYHSTELREEHVRASAAIPGLFPAVAVGDGEERHWYFDGGTRLNTPIKPALALGAERLIVVALNSLRPRPPQQPERQPDLLDGATQLIQAVLVDPLVGDVQTLVTINRMLLDRTTERTRENEQRTGQLVVPYVLIAPEDPDEIGRLATEVYREHFGSAWALARSPSVAGLGRLTAAGRSDDHGELLSYLFFAEEFTTRLIELGRRDAQLWLNQEHDHGIWQVGPL